MENTEQPSIIDIANKNLALGRQKRAENLARKRALEKLKNSPDPPTISLKPVQDLDISIPIKMTTNPEKPNIENQKVNSPDIVLNGSTGDDNSSAGSKTKTGNGKSSFKNMFKSVGEVVFPILFTLFFTFFGSYATNFIAGFSKRNSNFNSFNNPNSVSNNSPSLPIPVVDQPKPNNTTYSERSNHVSDQYSIFRKM